MPKIRRHNVPRRVFQHLLDRIESRQISPDQLGALAAWLDTEPTVPEGSWFKRFEGMTVAGDGELIKTFLLPDQSPVGQELE